MLLWTSHSMAIHLHPQELAVVSVGFYGRDGELPPSVVQVLIDWESGSSA